MDKKKKPDYICQPVIVPPRKASSWKLPLDVQTRFTDFFSCYCIFFSEAFIDQILKKYAECHKVEARAGYFKFEYISYCKFCNIIDFLQY